MPSNRILFKLYFSKHAKEYSKPNQTSKMEFFAKINNGFHPLTIFTKNSILDVWLGSEYPSAWTTKLSIYSLCFKLYNFYVLLFWRLLIVNDSWLLFPYVPDTVHGLWIISSTITCLVYHNILAGVLFFSINFTFFIQKTT